MGESEGSQPGGEEPEARSSRAGRDRRHRPTPMISRYWLTGRRRGGRRDGERQGIYVDRYTGLECVLVLWIVVAAGADLALTLLHLARGGEEANPVMAWFLEVGGLPAFTAAKVTMTAGAGLFLLWHIRFRGTQLALWGISALYAGVMVYHLFAFLDRQGALT
jgi:hypothetical protein